MSLTPDQLEERQELLSAAILHLADIIEELHPATGGRARRDVVRLLDGELITAPVFPNPPTEPPDR